MADLKDQLADLSALEARTDADERRILALSEKRHDELLGLIKTARAETRSGTAGAADRYLAFVQELGQINMIIGKARAVT